MTRPLIFALAILAVAPVLTSQEIPRFYHGTWRIDASTSMQYLEHVARFNRQQTGFVGRQIDAAAEQYEITIDETTLRIRYRDRTQAFTCRLRYWTREVVLLRCNNSSAVFTITTLHLGNGVKFLSSGSDDLDFFVWRRVMQSQPRPAVPRRRPRNE